MRYVLLIALLLLSATAKADVKTLTLTWGKPCSPNNTGYIIYLVDMYNGKTLQTGVGDANTLSYNLTVNPLHWYLLYMRTVGADKTLSTPSNVLQFDGSQTTLAVTQNPPPC